MEEKVELKQEELDQPRNYEIAVRDHRAYLLVNFALGVLEVLLAFRFFFKLLAANPQNIFAKIIYVTSDFFLYPFSGLFRSTVAADAPIQRVFEPATLVAMVVYVLLALAIGKFLLIIKSTPKAGN